MDRIWQEINRIPLVLMELLLGFALFWLGQLAYQKLFRRMNLNLQLFVRDNAAIAIALVGFYMGIAIALSGTLARTSSDWQYTLLNFTSYGAFSILLMLAGAWVCDRAILRRCDCAREIQEEHNVGAGSLEAGCHIGNGLILSSALGGEGGNLFVGLVCWLLGLGVLVLGFGLILLTAIRWLGDLILVPGVKISDEIAKQEIPNLGVGFIEAFIYIVSSALVAWAV